MTLKQIELSPDETNDVDFQTKRYIVAFWSEIHISCDFGATTWEVLNSLEKAVADCFVCNPPDLKKAESLTAQAALLKAGYTVL